MEVSKEILNSIKEGSFGDIINGWGVRIFKDEDGVRTCIEMGQFSESKLNG